MRWLVLSDLHYGVNVSVRMVKYQLAFLLKMNEFIMENEIDGVIIAGDTADKQQNSNNLICSIFRKAMTSMNELVEKTVVIAGNHDLFYKNSNEISSLRNFYQSGQVLVQTEPFSVSNVHFVPWICEENMKEIAAYVKKHNKPENILVGHFEFSGFAMNNHKQCTESQLPKSYYDKYDKVLSGHFHKPSKDKNVVYLGASTHIDKKFIGQPFFYVLDDKKMELKEHENTDLLFQKFVVEEGLDARELKKMFSDIGDKIIDVDIKTSDLKYLKKVEDIIYAYKPYKVDVSMNDGIPDFHSDIDLNSFEGFSDEKIILEYLEMFQDSDLFDTETRIEIINEFEEIRKKVKEEKIK